MKPYDFFLLLHEHFPDEVMVVVDVEAAGVEGIPEHLKEQVSLRMAFNGPNPIADFESNDVDWSAVLSFNQVQTPVRIPWAAVVAFCVPGYSVVLIRGEVEAIDLVPTKPAGLSVVR